MATWTHDEIYTELIELADSIDEHVTRQEIADRLREFAGLLDQN